MAVWVLDQEMIGVQTDVTGGLNRKSRCVGRADVKYIWAGVEIDRLQDESDQHAVARWFAEKAANDELRRGILSSKRFNKHKLRLQAFLSTCLDRASQGHLLPGTEVVPLSKAFEAGIPMFEFRWHFSNGFLNNGAKELIRHYDGEPNCCADCVFGLHVHLKSTDGSDEDIVMEQNKEIDRAIQCYLNNVLNNSEDK